MTTHYEKYKETIKKVARRNYRKRVAWLNTHLGNEHCIHCGESETVTLKLYPHDVEIRKKDVVIKSGLQSRKKNVCIVSLKTNEIRKIIREQL